MPKTTGEVFISYSNADSAFVRELMRELEAQGVPYWSDQKIEGGALWMDEIESAVKRASVFVLVISPNFLASKYTLMEAGVAVGRARVSGARIIPILLSATSLPPMFRDYQALHADSITVKDIATRLGSLASALDYKPERVQKELRLFVSSPSDVIAERECVSRVVEELNARVGSTEGITFLRYTWENVLPPIETKSIQEAVNEALSHVDVFLLILGSRIGTPIGPGRGSGTEEEFRMAIESSKHTGWPMILCYLKTAPIKIKSADQAEQLRRVLEFSDQLRKDRLVYEFESLNDLENAVRHSLTKIIKSEADRLTSA